MSKINIDIQELSEKYKSGLSASSLAQYYGVSVWAIITRLRNSGIYIRSNKEQNEKRLNLNTDQQSYLTDIVDGLLLGDGQIDPKGLLRVEQSYKRKCWLDDILNTLSIIGASSKIIPTKPKETILEGRTINSNGGFLLYTPGYLEFQEQRKRWYPDGIKFVPRDLKLSPLTLSYWFAGDGTCNSNGILSFCTNGFVKPDTEFLIEKIKELGIEANLSKTSRDGQYTIGIYKISEVHKLKDIIQPLLPECCQYKLRFVKQYTWCVKNLTYENIIEIRTSQQNKKELADKFKVSITSIRNIITGKTFKHIIPHL
jgi:hypothetical protein